MRDIRLFFIAVGLFAFCAVPLSAQPKPLSSDDVLAVTSSGDLGENAAKFAMDDNLDTRWESPHAVDPSWLQVQLKKEQSISSIEIDWETAAAKKYDIQISQNGVDWKNSATVEDGQPGEQRIIKFALVKTRFLRIFGRERTTQWGYSIWDIVLNAQEEPGLPLPDTGIDKLPYMNPSLSVNERADNLLKYMSLKEKISEISGKDNFDGRANDRLRIPALLVTDGPHGIRCFGEATCFPTLITAASWDDELMGKVGEAIGEEARAKGRNVVLGPCIGIHRTPLGGRNFESFSEDPYLISRMAVAYVNGVQSKKIGTSVKHFACNNQEWERGTINVVVSERALREIYLPGFRAAVVEGNATTVMGAYNKINGDWCCENKHILTDILKNEWGFKGLVVSDWGAVHDTLRAALAGCDLEMPGPGQFFGTSRIMSGIRKGTLSRSLIDDKVRRILGVKFQLGLFDGIEKKETGEANSKAHQDLARDIARNGIVLLKNERGILPLDFNQIKSVAVIGPLAKRIPVDGGGSSEVNPPYAISPYEGLKNRCGAKIFLRYAKGCGLPFDWQEVSLTGTVPGKTAKVKIICESQNMAAGKGYSFVWFDSAAIESASGPIEVKNPSFESGTDGWEKDGSAKDISIHDWHSYDKARSYGIGNDDGPDNASGTIFQTIDVTGKLKRGDACTFNISILPEKNYSGKARVRMEFLSSDDRILGSSQSEWVDNNAKPDVKYIADAVTAAKKSEVAIIFIGLNKDQESEGRDRDNMGLPPGQDDLVQAVSSVNKNTIVVLMNGTPVDMQKWIGNVPALIEAFYAGQEGGNACADILSGDVNPSGKLPFTFPKKLEDNPSFGNYPGSGGVVNYAEDILVGYRYYDTKNVEPAFPFGYGLSYTVFKYGDLQITPDQGKADGTMTVSLNVENSGKVDGKEVVQVYVRDIESSVMRPLKELKAYKKIALQPGEKKTVSFELRKDALSFYDPDKKQWTAEPGDFEIQIGSSSRDIRLTGKYTLTK